MSIKPHDPFQLHSLLVDLHEANAAQIVALTAIIEHQDDRLRRIEDLLTHSTSAELSN